MKINTVNITNDSIKAMSIIRQQEAEKIIQYILDPKSSGVSAWAQKFCASDRAIWRDYLFGGNEVSVSSWKDDVLAIIRQGQQMLLQAGEEGRLALTTQALEAAFMDDNECALYSALLFTLGVITPEGEFLPAGDAIEKELGSIEGIYIRQVTDEEVIKAFLIAASWIF